MIAVCKVVLALMLTAVPALMLMVVLELVFCMGAHDIEVLEHLWVAIHTGQKAWVRHEIWPYRY